MKNNELHLMNFEHAHYIDDSKCKVEDDFSCLGELLLQLYYSSYQKKNSHRKPWEKRWYNELDVNERELRFLRRLKGLDERYRSAKEIQIDFSELLKQQ
jgi:serine/threonine-protein kinase